MTDDKQITKDLIAKGADDIGQVVRRIRSIAPRPFMPIAVGIAGAAIVPIACELAVEAGSESQEPELDCMLLGALLAARCGTKSPDPVGAAYADFEALKAAGRLDAKGPPA